MIVDSQSSRWEFNLYASAGAVSHFFHGFSGYSGKFAVIQFHFMATTVVNDSGWYLDDIKITAQ